MRSYLVVWTIGAGLVAACGDDGTHHLVDGSLHDGPAQGDAKLLDAPVDAARQPVTLTVTLNGAPAAGVKAYFLDATSGVVANTLTGSDGTASELMEPGGSVTAIEPFDQASFAGTLTQSKLDTFAGVKPGDQLHIDVGGVFPPPVSITFNVTAPFDPNASHYALQTTCGAADLTPQVQLANRTAKLRSATTTIPTVAVTLEDCGGVADILLVSQDANFAPLATVYLPGHAVANGVDLTIPGPYVPATSDVVALTNLGSATTSVEIDKALIGPHGTLLTGFADTDIGSGGGSGSATIPFPLASATPGTTQIYKIDPSGRQPPFDRQTLIAWGSATDTFSLDATTIAVAGYATAPQYDLAAQTVTWTPEATGFAPDVVLTQIDVNRTDGSGNTADWQWQLAAPGSAAGAVHYPTLPTDGFDFNANGSDSLFLEQVGTAKVPGGYDAVRAHVFAFDPRNTLPPAGTSGTIAITQLIGPQLHAVHRGPRHRHLTHR